MKRILTILTMLIAFSAAAQKQRGVLLVNTELIASDKQLHFMAGAFIGSAVYGVVYGNSGGNRKKARVAGIVVATGAGILKECYDIGGSGFDPKDLAYTIAGGVTLVYTIDITAHMFKRK